MSAVDGIFIFCGTETVKNKASGPFYSNYVCSRSNLSILIVTTTAQHSTIVTICILNVFYLDLIWDHSETQPVPIEGAGGIEVNVEVPKS